MRGCRGDLAWSRSGGWPLLAWGNWGGAAPASPGGWRKIEAPCSPGHPLKLLLRDGVAGLGGQPTELPESSPMGGTAAGAPWLRCFLPGGFAGRNLIPSGNKFAWLALGQQLSPSRLPLAGTFQEDSLWAWPAAHSHPDVVIRCSWSSDFCQGNGGADLAGRIEILHLGNLGRLHWPSDHWAE